MVALVPICAFLKFNQINLKLDAIVFNHFLGANHPAHKTHLFCHSIYETCASAMRPKLMPNHASGKANTVVAIVAQNYAIELSYLFRCVPLILSAFMFRGNSRRRRYRRLSVYLLCEIRCRSNFGRKIRKTMLFRAKYLFRWQIKSTKILWQFVGST